MKLRAVLAVAALAAAVAPASGQKFPDRPLRVIVPFGAGSAVDANGRFIADALARELGQPVVVDNKPGADGAIGVSAVKDAPADGYTLLLASNSTLTVNPVVTKTLPYDPVKDLKPLAGITRGMMVFIVPTDSPVKTPADLVDAMKKAPAPLNVGTYSSGYRLAIEWFAGLAGVKFTNVPYKGSAPMFTDVVGGRLDWGVTDLIGASELVKAGKMRAIAVSGNARHPEYPDVPTLKESGFPDYVNYTWSALYVRADTPENVMRVLADAVQKVLSQPAVVEFARRAKLEVMAFPPAEMRKFQLDETARWARVAEAAGIKPE